MPQGVAWTPVRVALDRLRNGLVPITQTENVPLSEALGRVAAAPAHASRAHPPFANAAVDGYGFAHAGLTDAPAGLPLLSGRAAAGGAYEGHVPAGHAIRILTGAPIPEGVDTIVLEEDTKVADGAVHFETGLKRGANCRPAGEDVADGAPIIAAGRRLTPGDLALAASVGLGTLCTYRPLRVGVLSTGSELTEPGNPARPDQIYDANRPMLLSLAMAWGFLPVDLGRVEDNRAAVRGALDNAAANVDVILTSGGASAGDEDHMSAVLKEAGQLATWRIAVKPGRPLAMGLWQGCPVFGLPGNPVAAFVCALIFARPALNCLAGGAWAEPVGHLLPARFAKKKKPGRVEYLRARRSDDGGVEVFHSEGSGRVSGLSWADGLVELPHDQGAVAPGDAVRYLPFSALGL